jgi:hypothetical protein
VSLIPNSGWGSLANWTTTNTSGNGALNQYSGWGGLAIWPTPQPTTTTTTVVETPPPPPVDPDAERVQNAMDYLRKWFASVGIILDAELEGILLTAMKAGYTPADIESGLLIPEIEKTAAFKARFPGYEAFKANHQGQAINLATYRSLEIAYTDILRNAGMPAGFYDDHADFGQWIAKGVSPEELQRRVDLALDAAKGVDPTMRNLMARFYGLSTGDVAAYFLDPNRARDTIEHQYASAGVASWAARSGFAVNDMARYEQLVADGITVGQAAQSYGTIKSLQEAVGKSAGIYGETYGQTDAEDDVFFNRNDKRRRIMNLEQGTFGGSTSGATGQVQRQSY